MELTVVTQLLGFVLLTVGEGSGDRVSPRPRLDSVSRSSGLSGQDQAQPQPCTGKILSVRNEFLICRP